MRDRRFSVQHVRYDRYDRFSVTLHWLMAALYHQCVLKDGLLQRMRWRGPGTR